MLTPGNEKCLRFFIIWKMFTFFFIIWKFFKLAIRWCYSFRENIIANKKKSMNIFMEFEYYFDLFFRNRKNYFFWRKNIRGMKNSWIKLWYLNIIFFQKGEIIFLHEKILQERNLFNKWEKEKDLLF